MIEGDQHRAAADVDVVLEHEGDGLRAKRFVDHAVVSPDLFHGRHDAGGEREEFLAGAHDAAGDLAAEAAEIVERGVGRAVGAVDPLHGQAETREVKIARDVDGLEVAEERGAGVPRRVRRGLDDVVAVERAQRDEFHVLDVEPREKRFELGADFQEARFAPADEIHFVNGDDEVRDAQERGDGGVAATLLDDAEAGVDEDDGQVGRGRAGHHVARVLDVAGRVGDDELAARRGEVAVSDVDGDALFALGAEAVGEVGEVDLAAAGDVGRALEGLDLILHEGFRIVEQAPDECGFTVVDAAARVEAEDIDGPGRRDGMRHGDSGRKV